MKNFDKHSTSIEMNEFISEVILYLTQIILRYLSQIFVTELSNFFLDSKAKKILYKTFGYILAERNKEIIAHQNTCINFSHYNSKDALNIESIEVKRMQCGLHDLKSRQEEMKGKVV